MIEHKPWPGSGKKIAGLRIAIVGYSHYYTKKSEECDEFTLDIVKRAVKGEMKENTFFPAIPKYFGFENDEEHKDFWKRVLFFNFLPRCIGNVNEKHKKAGKDMTDCAKKRFKQILAEEQPDCVFVFTTKGWKDCPPTLYEEKYNKRPKDLTDVCTWGQYDCDGHMVTAFGLHHPQGANTENMKKAVSKALDKARTLRTRA